MLVVKKGAPGTPVTVLGECTLNPEPKPDSEFAVMDPADVKALEETFDPRAPASVNYLRYRTSQIGYFEDGKTGPTFEVVVEIDGEDPTKLPGWTPAVIYSDASSVVESEASQNATNDNTEKEK